MPYLPVALTHARQRPAAGFGQSTVGLPGGGTAEEWGAYESRIRWRRVSAATGPRGTDWADQAIWAAQALQKLIAGESVTVPPFPTDPELLALLVNGRTWLLTMPEWEIADLFPGVTPRVMSQARRLLLPGNDVVAIARAKLEGDAVKFKDDYDRMVVLRGELQRYLQFAQDTLQQFQTYVAWFQRHEEKKSERTEVVSRALTAISTVLYFVPVVGWALGALVDTANFAIQLDRMKSGIAAMQEAGLKIAGAQLYVAVMEAVSDGIYDVERARDEAEWMLMLTREQLVELDKVRAIGGGAAASDGSIIGALRGEVSKARRMFGGAGALLAVAAVGVVALLALFRRKRVV